MQSPIPQRVPHHAPRAAGAKTGWRLAWLTLMRELAPQSKDGAFQRPSYAYAASIGDPGFPVSGLVTMLAMCKQSNSKCSGHPGHAVQRLSCQCHPFSSLQHSFSVHARLLQRPRQPRSYRRRPAAHALSQALPLPVSHPCASLLRHAVLRCAAMPGGAGALPCLCRQRLPLVSPCAAGPGGDRAGWPGCGLLVRDRRPRAGLPGWLGV